MFFWFPAFFSQCPYRSPAILSPPHFYGDGCVPLRFLEIIFFESPRHWPSLPILFGLRRFPLSFPQSDRFIFWLMLCPDHSFSGPHGPVVTHMGRFAPILTSHFSLLPPPQRPPFFWLFLFSLMLYPGLLTPGLRGAVRTIGLPLVVFDFSKRPQTSESLPRHGNTFTPRALPPGVPFF